MREKHLGSAKGLVGFYVMALFGVGREQPEKQIFFKERKGVSMLPGSMLFTKMHVYICMYAYLSICTLITAYIGMQMWIVAVLKRCSRE